MAHVGQLAALSPVEGMIEIYAPTLSDLITLHPSGPHLIIVPILSGNVTNQTLLISIAIVDCNGLETWSEPQELDVRALPNGVKICTKGIYELYRSKTCRIAMESVITGGGTVSLYQTCGVLS